MSLAQRFERRLEDVVGAAFARVFKGQVEPVEIGSALQREAADKRNVMGSGRVLAPNRYRVTLAPSDHERLVPWEVQLTNSLAELVQEYLDENRWRRRATSRSTSPATTSCTPACSASRHGWSPRRHRAAGRTTRCHCPRCRATRPATSNSPGQHAASAGSTRATTTAWPRTSPTRTSGVRPRRCRAVRATGAARAPAGAVVPDRRSADSAPPLPAGPYIPAAPYSPQGAPMGPPPGARPTGLRPPQRRPASVRC